MAQLQQSLDIARPLAEVFAFVANPATKVNELSPDRHTAGSLLQRTSESGSSPLLGQLW
jgi:hypothetical protein